MLFATERGLFQLKDNDLKPIYAPYNGNIYKLIYNPQFPNYVFLCLSPGFIGLELDIIKDNTGNLPDFRVKNSIIFKDIIFFRQLLFLEVLD